MVKMNHVSLLGDSTLDNGSYTEGMPDVFSCVQKFLPIDWVVTLGAIDGATTDDISLQLENIPASTTHLVLSVGGNNTLLRADLLELPVSSTSEALLLLSEAIRDFEMSYRRVIEECLDRRASLIVCTIYNGNFPDPGYQRRATVALSLFNDVIIRVAVEFFLAVIDLRFICNSAGDFYNPIEPSAIGGSKIAEAISMTLTQSSENNCTRIFTGSSR